MKQLNRVFITILLFVSLLIMSSCDQGEWPIGKDTVASWKHGKIQIQRDPAKYYVLVVDHKTVWANIGNFCSDSSCVYMVSIDQRCFTVFHIDEEEMDLYYPQIESIPDLRLRDIFSALVQ